MNTAISDKIKKLLKNAKSSTGHEAASARRLAIELMERHGVNVSADETRVMVDGVLGVYWRERVLSACAKKYGCKASKTDHIIVIGEDDGRVHAAITLYEYLCSEIMKASLSSFGTQIGNRDRALELATGLWYRIFLNTVADKLLEIVTPVKPRRPAPYFEPWPEQYLRMQEKAKKRTSTSDLDERKIADDTLAATVTETTGNSFLTEQLIRAAEWEALRCAATLNLEYRQSHLLAAASSFLPPPPKPNRFTFLDVDFE